MKTPMRKAANSSFLAIAAACVLGGCVAYGPVGAPYQSGDYYDQYSPAYNYYPGQPGYPYATVYYGYPVIFGPSIYFGTYGGSGGIGVGTTFGW